MKKKTVSLLVCVAMLSTLLVGCGEKEVPAAEPVAEVTELAKEEEVVPETEVAPITEESTEEAVKEVKEAENYVPGTWDGNVYINTSLGFLMTVPEDYVILTGDDLQGLVSQSEDMLSENSNLGEVSASDSVLYEFMAASPDQTNTNNVMFTVQKNEGLTSEQFGDVMIDGFAIAGIPCELFAEPSTTKIGDIEFYEVDMALDYSQIVGIEGYMVLQTVIAYANEESIYYFTFTFNENTIEKTAGILQSIQPLEVVE